jgi:hypothetical protein
MEQVSNLQAVSDARPACVHHWVLGDPQDSVIPGRCKRCGGERTFAARTGEADRYEDDSSDVASTPVEPGRLAG